MIGDAVRRQWTGAVVTVALVLVMFPFVGAGRSDAADPVPETAGRFVPLPPTRIVDTRVDSLGLGWPRPYFAGIYLTFPVAGQGGVPASGVTAVALNVTVTNTYFTGYTTISPPGVGSGGVSTLNTFGANATRANFAIVPLSSSGTLQAHLVSGGDLIVDVAGYWTSATSATAGRFVSVPPERLLDSRIGRTTRLAAGAITTVPRSAFTTVPASATAVAVTVTATDTVTPGHATLWPAASPRPTLTSTLNFGAPGETIPNLALVPIDANGVSLYNSGAAHLLLDVVGYVTGAAAPSSTDGLFVPVQNRIVDSRLEQGTERLARGLLAEVDVAGTAGVPASGVGAVAVNLTTTSASSGGFGVVWPSQTARPTVSSTNFVVERDIATAAITGLGANGRVSLFGSTSTEVIVDVAGYFLGTASAATTTTPPRACKDMMVYLHSPTRLDPGYVYVKDLSGRLPETWVNVGLDVAAVRLAPTCDFLLVAVENRRVEDTYDIYYVENFIQPNPAAQRVPMTKIIDAMYWHSVEVSSNGRWIFAYAGTVFRSGRPIVDVIAAYDVRNNFARRFGAIMGPGGSLVSIVHGDLVQLQLTAYQQGWDDGQLRRCQYGNIVISEFQCGGFSAQDYAYNAAVYEELNAFQTRMLQQRRDGVYLDGRRLDAGRLPRFTMQGDPVLSNDDDAGGATGVWRYPFGDIARKTKVLDNVFDHSPTFARRYRAVEPVFGPDLFAPQVAGAGATAAGPPSGADVIDLDRCTPLESVPALPAPMVSSDAVVAPGGYRPLSC